MMRWNRTLLLTLLAMALPGAGCASPENGALGREAPAPIGHGVVAVDEIVWEPGPPSLPAGAEVAVLEGDPGEPGPFVMRLRVPDGYTVPPHWHPQTERVTVLQGTFHLGMSEQMDLDLAEPLRTGSFVSMPPEMVHFARAEGETIIQLHGEGPWGIVYADPADDPRR